MLTIASQSSVAFALLRLALLSNNGVTTTLSKKFVEETREKLEKEKRLLEEELESFAKNDPEVEGNYKTIFPDYGKSIGDQDENTDEVEEYLANIPVEHTLELQLKNVNQALERIRRKRYGICATCKKQIPRERLLASPTARTCIECNHAH